MFEKTRHLTALAVIVVAAFVLAGCATYEPGPYDYRYKYYPDSYYYDHYYGPWPYYHGYRDRGHHSPRFDRGRRDRPAGDVPERPGIGGIFTRPPVDRPGPDAGGQPGGSGSVFRSPAPRSNRDQAPRRRGGTAPIFRNSNPENFGRGGFGGGNRREPEGGIFR